MANNTFQHISNESRYVAFDPTETNFPKNVKDVQTALSMTSPTAYATYSQAGVVQLATKDEAIAGTDTKKVITPFTLNERLKFPDASLTQKGVIQLASNAEATAGTDDKKAIVPSSLKATFDWYWVNKPAKEATAGVIKLSTKAAAIAGVDDLTAMTPLKVKQAIAQATAQIPSPETATEQKPGLVQLATAGQAQAGVLRDGYAVSPFTLNKMTGSLTTKGMVQAATLAQANLGTDDGLYISAKGFKTYIATTTNVGTVKLTTDKSTVAGNALASNAKVLFTNDTAQQKVTGPVDFAKVTKNGQDLISTLDIHDHMPTGSVIMWMSDNLPSNLWAFCDGGKESKAARPKLFEALQYKFGGSGDSFNRPDMRGLFPRGAGLSKHILDETGQDGKGKNKLGEGLVGTNVGQVQKQQTRVHKHALSDGEYRRDWFLYGATVSRGFGGGRNTKWDNHHEFTNDGTEVDPANIRDEWGTMNTVDAMGVETRPWNMSVNYIIKVA